MFRKPGHVAVGPSAVLANKVNRQLRDALSAEFGTEAIAQAFGPHGDRIVEAKLGPSKLKTYLVNEGKQQMVPLFIDLNPKSKDFARDSQFMPTVFALFRAPLAFQQQQQQQQQTEGPCARMPCVVVGPAVSSYILDGADLMLPGVLRRHLPLQALGGSGQRVLLRVEGNPVPFAVARSLRAGADMVDAACPSGMAKGKGFEVLHCYRDELWASGSRLLPPDLHWVTPPGFGHTRIAVVQAEGASTAAAAAAAANTPGGDETRHIDADADSLAADLARSLGVSPVETAPADPAAAAESAADDSATDDSIAQTDADGADKPVHEDAPLVDANTAADEGTAGSDPTGSDPQQPFWASWTADELFSECFLQALRRRVKPKDLPILASAFFSRDLAGVRPVGSSVEVRRTSWKKAGCFLSYMEDEGVVSVGEARGGVLYITEVHKDCPRLKAHRMWPLAIEHDASAGAGGGDGSGGTEGDGEGLGVDSGTRPHPGYVPFDVTTLVQPCAAMFACFRRVYAHAAAEAERLLAEGKERDSRAVAPLLALLGTHRDAILVADDAGLEQRAGPGVGSDDDDDDDDVVDSDSDADAPGADAGATARASVDMRKRYYDPGAANAALTYYYTKVRPLVVRRDPRRVLLDLPLSAALSGPAGCDARDDLDESVDAAEEDAYYAEAAASAAVDEDSTLPRKDAGMLWAQRLVPCHSLRARRRQRVLKRGLPPPVLVKAEYFKGMKRAVTHVSGLEYYGIDPQGFAQGASRLFASATSTQALKPKAGGGSAPPANKSGGKKSTPAAASASASAASAAAAWSVLQEVLIQGDEERGVGTLLMEVYGLDASHVHLASTPAGPTSAVAAAPVAAAGGPSKKKWKSAGGGGASKIEKSK
jgi:predicted ribosome-associated RNA-binding protein Tma20